MTALVFSSYAGAALADGRTVLTLSGYGAVLASSEDTNTVFNRVDRLSLAVSIRNPPRRASRVRVNITGIGCDNNCHTQQVTKKLGKRLDTLDGVFRSTTVRTDRWGCGKPRVKVQVLSSSGAVLLTKRWKPNTACGE